MRRSARVVVVGDGFGAHQAVADAADERGGLDGVVEAELEGGRDPQALNRARR